MPRVCIWLYSEGSFEGVMQIVALKGLCQCYAKCGSPAFSTFSTMFSNRHFYRGLQKSSLCGKGLRWITLYLTCQFWALPIQ